MREEGINLNDIFYIIKQRWKMIILVTMLTTLVAGVFSFYVIKPTYEGRVKVFIGKEGATRESKDYSNTMSDKFISYLTSGIQSFNYNISNNLFFNVDIVDNPIFFSIY